MPSKSKPKTKRCIVYMPERLYYRLASYLKRRKIPMSVSEFMRASTTEFLKSSKQNET